VAVDLSDLVESLRREVEIPGASDNLTALTDSQLTGYLSDSFWEATLDGVVSGYTESDGIVSPVSGTTEFSRELQQLVVFYAGFRIVRNQKRDIKTLFRVKAGVTEYEVQQSAQLLKALMDDLTRKRNIVLDRLGESNVTAPYVIDSVRSRNESMYYGDTDWLNY
jgi:hypothetical protein